jgi:acetyl esterase/lipase
LGLGALASTLPVLHSQAGPLPLTFGERELEVPGEKLARRCLLLVPAAPEATRRVVVLFHGLAETSSEAVGIRAWADRYGLVAAAARLQNPPVARTVTQPVLLTDARLGELNRALAADPYRGLAVACPYTPNVFRQPSTPLALDRYSAWLADGLLPEIRKILPLVEGPSAVAVDGVSLGGYVSLEVFLRRPEVFGAVGALQAAIGDNLADYYATRFKAALERVGPRPLRIATTAWDKERPTSEHLAARLRAHGVPVTLDTSPGGHDQGFLREAGSLELLYYYDRTLPRSAGKPG